LGAAVRRAGTGRLVVVVEEVVGRGGGAELRWAGVALVRAAGLLGAEVGRGGAGREAAAVVVVELVAARAGVGRGRVEVVVVVVPAAALLRGGGGGGGRRCRVDDALLLFVDKEAACFGGDPNSLLKKSSLDMLVEKKLSNQGIKKGAEIYPQVSQNSSISE